ncbi:hypothetical protein DAETH_39930 (plasmid) [Deinococcus aetherius]|uniref:histidine kinase n=1 Tax=Deinococcus aetherius TaxID=200252 RepID=A0ABM8AJN3_9DEIO|nr:ATP-binding protein [Deinococcus aetherius]BDP44024.1 hypothetical protein DAETH_39930 [Deinococcus aetherius]
MNPAISTAPPPFQPTIDALSAHVAVVDSGGWIVAVNRAWRQFCEDNGGAAGSCGVGSNYLAVCGGEGGGEGEACAMTLGLLAVLRGEVPEFVLAYPCHSPREQRWFRARVTPVRAEGGHVTHAVVAHENITERELGLLALQESEARFRALADVTPIGMAVGTLDGELEYVNEAFLRLVGVERAAYAGGRINWLDLTPPEWRHTDRLAAAQVAERGVSRPYEKEYRRPDGTRVPVLLALAGYGVGGRERLCGYMLDLTDRKRAEAELRDLNTRLEALVEQRTGELMDLNLELQAYAEAVTRQLRAPVARVLNFARLLRAGLDASLGERQRLHFGHLHSEAERVAGLLEDLREFTARPAPPPHGEVPLAVLVAQVRSDLLPLTRGRRVEWRVGELPTVRGDPLRLRQAVTHLLTNALKFTRGREQALIEVGARREAGEWVVLVRDNGVGFDSAHAGELFRVFARLHPEMEGTGVGLANVRRVIQQHGGRVGAHAEPGAGATFWVTFPCAPGEGAP